MIESGRSTVIGLVVMVLFSGCAQEETGLAGDDAAPRQASVYAAETFFQTTTYTAGSANGYAFTPDAAAVLLNSDTSGIFNAYKMPVDGGTPVPLTDSAANAVFGLSFFPEDERLLYTADVGGNELNHVYVRAPDGTVTDLTPGDELKARFVGWAGKDGFWLASTERDARNYDLYAYAVAGYARELIFKNEQGWQIDAVSRDQRWLAVTRNRNSADSDIYLIDLESDDQIPILITGHEGNVTNTFASFAPDSSALIYTTDEHGEFAGAWSYEISNSEGKTIAEADWDVSLVVFSRGGRYRVTGVNADARTEVTIHDHSSGAVVELPALPAGDLRNVRFSSDDSKLAFLINSDVSPSNLNVVDLASATHRQLTQALSADINPTELVEAQIVRYPSFDSLEIPALLYTPKNASPDNPVPALVWVHGGPGGQSRTGYSPTIQHLVNHGYAVLAANNRGSSGYGKTFYHLDDRNHGEQDLQDIVWGRRYLESLDWVDPGSIGVIGGSYGGYMAAAALAFEPQTFDVGVNIFGVTNWVRTLNNIPPWWEDIREALYDEMGDPATDDERHRRISPLFHAANIIKPLLVVQGANDPRVLQAESDEIVAAVRKNDVPVEYLLFPDEGHGFRNRDNRIAASNAYVRFLDKYLKKQAAD